jgi:predicted nucleic-acid-binding protein
LCNADELKVESADAVWQAVRKFRKGVADIADYLIGARNAMHDAVPTFTFDKKASSDPDFRLLTP